MMDTSPAYTNSIADTSSIKSDLMIDISNLNYWYPDQATQALKGINFQVKTGEFVVVMGPTGSGKSTLALCLNGIIPWVMGGKIGGSIKVSGWLTRDHSVSELATKVALVQQDPESQLCTLYVKDEIAFGPQNLMQSKEQILSKLDNTIKLVGLEGYENKPIFLMSGGEKQRLAIAAGIIMEPMLLVLDEPTANLDPAGTDEVFRLIRTLRETTKTTIVLFEHKIDKIVDVADRLVIFQNGQILLDGNPRRILEEHGEKITNEIGVWIPQASQFALGAIKKGYLFNEFPINVGEIDNQKISFSLEMPKPVQRNELDPVGTSEIKFENVDFTYPDGTEALKNVSLEINKGSVLGLLGKNGSGKSTLCSMCVGLNLPSNGRVIVSGSDVSSATIRELASKVGYVFQYPEHQFVTDNVYDEVVFGLSAVRSLSAGEIDDKALSILTKLGLDKMIGRHPFELSMGQKRRLSIASIMVLEPEILILDEPTSGQDRRHVENLMKLILELSTKQLTLILITHDMNLLGRYVTDTAVLDNGELVFTGKPNRLFRKIIDGQLEALDVPETFKLVQRLRNAGISCPDSFYPEDLAERLIEVDSV